MQGEDGLWRQLLDHPEAWPETSGTGMFAFAMVTGVKARLARRGDVRPGGAKGLAGPAEYIDANGQHRQRVRRARTRGPTVQYYLDRPRNVGDLHGQAPVLWTASALMRK